MSCYYPMVMSHTGRLIDGKREYKLLGCTWSQAQELIGNLAPDQKIIPCGNCLGCRLDYSRLWADRCMLEMQYHHESWFLTLTYDEAHVPRSFYPNPETGEAVEARTLRKTDFQKFLKRLRYYHHEPIRYFGSSEYGDNTFRPHYHCILFGFHPRDLVLSKIGKGGYEYYESPELESIWSNGNITLTPASWDTCAYTARYILKKLRGHSADIYGNFRIEPPSSLMSRRPGIGRMYYDDHGDAWKKTIFLATDRGGRRIRPPKYYERLFKDSHPDEWQQYSEERRYYSEQIQKFKLSQTDQSFEDMLQTEEFNKQQSIKSLVRDI